MNNTINISVPNLPESIVDATILSWHKRPGDIVTENDILLDIETDKIVLEIPATCTGKLESIIADTGQIVSSGQTVGTLVVIKNNVNTFIQDKQDNAEEKNEFVLETSISPTVRRLLTNYNLTHSQICGTGIKNRITKEDVINYIKQNNLKIHSAINDKKNNNQDCTIRDSKNRRIERSKISKLRQKISERLLETKNNVVSLTTFNEVNMYPVLTLKKTYGELFKRKHGVKLGLMPFFIKAVIEALKIFPEINASIDHDDIIYYKYFDINIAISTSRGLVAPILKDANLMSMAQIEKSIQELVTKSKNFQLTVDDLKSGNFTITNGGIFGSLFSTPLINPPQSAILGMHAIKNRPVVKEGEIKILPMMYLALTYDHRLIDGKESIGFLLTIKELLEDFNRIILNI